MMDDFIDPSDPDLDVPNSIHAYQTAERIRKKHPEDKELQIAGLIHDLGKFYFLMENQIMLLLVIHMY
jgi:inositol oxygenase